MLFILFHPPSVGASVYREAEGNANARTVQLLSQRKLLGRSWQLYLLHHSKTVSELLTPGRSTTSRPQSSWFPVVASKCFRRLVTDAYEIYARMWIRVYAWNLNFRFKFRISIIAECTSLLGSRLFFITPACSIRYIVKLIRRDWTNS